LRGSRDRVSKQLTHVRNPACDFGHRDVGVVHICPFPQQCLANAAVGQNMEYGISSMEIAPTDILLGEGIFHQFKGSSEMGVCGWKRKFGGF
jgi:hypothetical protein